MIVERISDISRLRGVRPGCVLTIGNFDGVHIGHQEILRTAKKAALENDTELVVMTFEPHPAVVLQPARAPAVLTPPALKERLLQQFGADRVVVVRGTAELFGLSPEDFVRRFLVEQVRPALVVEGEGFRFGAKRAGDIHMLERLGAENGFEVRILRPRQVELSGGRSQKVSSTVIRDLLASGSVSEAALALGRPYRLVERVVPGRSKGRRLGFPTANMRLPQQLIPAQGVYACYAHLADAQEQICCAEAKTPAALSIGTAAGGEAPLVEAHLLDQQREDLYGKWLAVDFVERIREQEKFASEAELAAQIARDCARIRKILAGGKGR